MSVAGLATVSAKAGVTKLGPEEARNAPTAMVAAAATAIPIL
jgi:hypothetical protein